jgi:hypothetical protein
MWNPSLEPIGRKRKKRQVLENPKVHRIDSGTLTGRVFGGFGVKHERTTDSSRWAAAASSATSALICVPRTRHRKRLY